MAVWEQIAHDIVGYTETIETCHKPGEENIVDFAIS